MANETSTKKEVSPEYAEEEREEPVEGREESEREGREKKKK